VKELVSGVDVVIWDKKLKLSLTNRAMHNVHYAMAGLNTPILIYNVLPRQIWSFYVEGM